VGFAVAGAWLFENLLNIARYMADARAQILPLVGGGEHDWTNIFSRWDVLASDTLIAPACGRRGMARTSSYVVVDYLAVEAGHAGRWLIHPVGF
jgi:hypothetical protein